MNKARKLTINQIVKKAFLIPGIVIFIFSFSIITYFFYTTYQKNKLQNLENFHVVITKIIQPYLLISDTANVRKFLTFLTQPDQILAVVNDKQNIVMSDYSKLNIVKKAFLNVADDRIKCSENSYKKTFYFDNEKYLVFCTNIDLPKGYEIKRSEENLGMLLSFTKNEVFPFSPIIFLYLAIIVFALFIILTRWIYILLKKGILSPFEYFFKQVIKSHEKNVNALIEIPKNNERAKIVEFEKVLEAFIKEVNKRSVAEKQAAIGSVVAQVAHDIRSPLATINVVVKESNELEEQKRIMLRNATQQLNDIANVLLLKYRSKTDASLLENNTTKDAEVIAVLLDLIVSEKRLQYKHLPITIDFDIDVNARGAFAQIVVRDFKRVISNIINNAVEALNGKGEIQVHLSKTDTRVNIEISDNGVGMPPELIAKVFDGSITSNKKEGSGIGLVSAYQLIKSWGGDLNITSQTNVGTTLHLSFVLLEPASWFSEKLSLSEGCTVVILDDDQSIHDLWESRFTHEISNANLQLMHFYQAEELIRYDRSQLKSAYFLCDYELIGQDKTGLDVIEQLQLGNAATLVTSRYDDQDVRARCAKLGIKILPKNYAAYAPICIFPKTSSDNCQANEENLFDLVLIDNDPLVIATWKFSAKSKNKKILSFSSFEEAQVLLQNLNRSIPIYIDSDLGTNIPGEEYAKKLYEQGFATIYLATGHSAAHFGSMPWIKNIVGKEPVF